MIKTISTNLIIIISLFLITLLIGLIYSNTIKNQSANSRLDNNKAAFSNIVGWMPSTPYFAPDIYIVPGQAKLAHNKYTPDYMPYESAIPAIDVLRANNQLQAPSYLQQVWDHNTTPYSIL